MQVAEPVSEDVAQESTDDRGADVLAQPSADPLLRGPSSARRVALALDISPVARAVIVIATISVSSLTNSDLH